MASSRRTQEKADGNQTNSCDNDWCDGPQSDTLPCFECFDPSQDYDVRTHLDAREAQSG
jgi:hypothetical protein